MNKSKGVLGCLVVAAAAHVACGDDGATGGAGGSASTTNTTSGSGSTKASSGTGAGSTTGATTGATTTAASTVSGSSSTGMAVQPQENWARDVKSYALSLDLANLKGTATIVLADAASEGASFEIGDLNVTSVTDGQSPLLFEAVPGTGPNPQQLNIGVPDVAGDSTLVIEYDFAAHSMFDGWMPDSGLSFLWPYFCGNLFPCKSDTTDGATFTLAVTGVPANQTAVFPASISADAPSYMPAIAIGAFTKVPLGTTTNGTNVSVWHLPGQDAAAAAGTANLVGVFNFYEQTYGAYSFGNDVGTVQADWGPGAYGGMEHHPYWHVATDALGSEEVNAHEAAHGWFGDGVRIDCWEDFVLSEGTATYLAARSLSEFGVDLWPDYECGLKSVCQAQTPGFTVVYPATCDTIDIFNDPLWSYAPYMKGAFFWKSVADIIGEDVLDEAFAEFYQAHVGKAATMQALVDHVKTKASVQQLPQVEAAEQGWLHELACPVDTSALCP